MAKRDRESTYFRNRRRQREKMLARVGVESPAGQRLLDRWWRDDRATITSAREKSNE